MSRCVSWMREYQSHSRSCTKNSAPTFPIRLRLPSQPNPQTPIHPPAHLHSPNPQRLSNTAPPPTPTPTLNRNPNPAHEPASTSPSMPCAPTRCCPPPLIPYPPSWPRCATVHLRRNRLPPTPHPTPHASRPSLLRNHSSHGQIKVCDRLSTPMMASSLRRLCTSLLPS